MHTAFVSPGNNSNFIENPNVIQHNRYGSDFDNTFGKNQRMKIEDNAEYTGNFRSNTTVSDKIDRLLFNMSGKNLPTNETGTLNNNKIAFKKSQNYPLQQDQQLLGSDEKQHNQNRGNIKSAVIMNGNSNGAPNIQ